MSVEPNTQPVDLEPVATLDLEALTQRYWDVKGHDRTCLNCGRLRREESTRPDDEYFENTYRSVIKDVYIGEEPRDRRYTDVDGVVGVYCDDCGTTNSHTLVYEGDTLSTGALCDRAEGVITALGELFGEGVDEDAAIEYILEVKRDPDTTNWPADDVLERAIAVGLAESKGVEIETADITEATLS